MSPNDEAEYHIQRFIVRLPDRLRPFVHRLRRPSSRWARIPLAILFLLGGTLWFLPIVGLWMLPLGALLLAEDLPFLKRHVVAALLWLERRWARWRAGRAG